VDESFFSQIYLRSEYRLNRMCKFYSIRQQFVTTVRRMAQQDDVSWSPVWFANWRRFQEPAVCKPSQRRISVFWTARRCGESISAGLHVFVLPGSYAKIAIDMDERQTRDQDVIGANLRSQQKAREHQAIYSEHLFVLATQPGRGRSVEGNRISTFHVIHGQGCTTRHFTAAVIRPFYVFQRCAMCPCVSVAGCRTQRLCSRTAAVLRRHVQGAVRRRVPRV